MLAARYDDAPLLPTVSFLNEARFRLPGHDMDVRQEPLSARTLSLQKGSIAGHGVFCRVPGARRPCKEHDNRNLRRCWTWGAKPKTVVGCLHGLAWGRDHGDEEDLVEELHTTLNCSEGARITRLCRLCSTMLLQEAGCLRPGSYNSETTGDGPAQK